MWAAQEHAEHRASVGPEEAGSWAAVNSLQAILGTLLIFKILTMTS